MVRLLEDLTELEKLALLPMSYSRLNNFKMCEAMYFYTSIAKEPSIFGEAAKMGNVIHSVLENMLERNVPVDKMRTGEYYDEFLVQMNEHDPDGIISQNYIDIGIDIMQDFLDRHHGESFRIHEKELGFEVAIGGCLFRGYIDRVDMTKDTIYITDYKTGKNEVAQKWVHKDLQLGIYVLAVAALFPEFDKIYAELYYLKSGKQKGHLFTRDDLPTIESDLLELVSQVTTKRFFNETTNGRICSFCDHAASGACKVGARRVRR